jgi:D-alanyl-D-alanine carboxypeptidase/D-alanyl-D-alanine-endopeptidase (penicillin-binding protein 4)
MKNFVLSSIRWFSVFAFSLLFASAIPAQTRPLLQDIVIKEGPAPQATPLVKKTGSSTAVADDVVPAVPSARAAIKTSIPVLADVEIPGYTGILVESMEGNVVVETGSDMLYNPASNVKIATAYAGIKTFGPNYRFPTNVWTDGAYDEANKAIIGDLYITGRDPVFNFENAIAIANELNRIGIRSVSGDLIVTGDFTMNYSSSATRSANTLLATLDMTKRSAAATRSWLKYTSLKGLTGKVDVSPSIQINGKAYVRQLPGDAKMIFSHESAPMREIVKVTLSYSNNFLAERLGDMVGGPYAVANIVRTNGKLDPKEFYLATSSGLGSNRVSPRAMMSVLRMLNKELHRNNMSFADIMPVAGIDRGTLEHRFDTDFSEGSVIGKTGTLYRTDGGASALCGEINTRGGKLLFVIFNQRGSVPRFRSFQNNYVALIQGQFGGPAKVNYRSVPMDSRIAQTRIVAANARSSGN